MDLVAIAVGQFIKRKGFDVLIRAWSDLPSNNYLYILGDNPTDEYFELISKYNMKNIHFPGFKTKSELLYYYRAADLFIMPTREDVWGLVVNEAIAAGLPVIATLNCGAAKTLVKDGENGFIIPLDEVIIRKKVLEIFDDGPTRKRMALRSLQIAHEFTIEKMAMAYSRVMLKGYVNNEIERKASSN